MKNYSIKAKTNGYNASRDAKFKGKCEITLTEENILLKKDKIIKEIERLDNNLKSMYITNRWHSNWFNKLTESRMIIRKLYTLIN